MKNRIHLARRRANAFTLIEILLVMLITSVLVLGVNAAFKQAHAVWSRVETQRPVYQETRLFFDTLKAELSCLYLPMFDDDQEMDPFALSVSPEGTVRLSFLTLNPAWKNTAVSNRPAKLTYECTTDSDSGQRILSRTEQLFSGQRPIGSEQKDILLTGFSGLTILAADPNAAGGDSWKDTLQCRQAPPQAVKIQLEWSSDAQTAYAFETIVKITCRGQMTLP